MAPAKALPRIAREPEWFTYGDFIKGTPLNKLLALNCNQRENVVGSGQGAP